MYAAWHTSITVVQEQGKQDERRHPMQAWHNSVAVRLKERGNQKGHLPMQAWHNPPQKPRHRHQKGHQPMYDWHKFSCDTAMLSSRLTCAGTLSLSCCGGMPSTT